VQVPDFSLALLAVVMLVVIFRYLRRWPAISNSLFSWICPAACGKARIGLTPF
jgi:hypothetical protein